MTSEPSTIMYITVSKRLDRLAIDVLEAATASQRTLAEEAGLHYTTLTRWRSGEMHVGPESALRVAEVVRRRALSALELAARLEAEAESEEASDA